MTESVIIHGRDLTVEHNDAPAAGEPIRRRPGPVPSTVTAPSKVNTHTIGLTNPFWSDEANRAAENRPEGVTLRDVARQYKNHRIAEA